VVYGSNRNPLYAELAKTTGQTPQWNFHKYLIDRSGKRITSFPSEVNPADKALVFAVEKAMNEKASF
jgi:glutathione peroxidase